MAEHVITIGMGYPWSSYPNLPQRRVYKRRDYAARQFVETVYAAVSNVAKLDTTDGAKACKEANEVYENAMKGKLPRWGYERRFRVTFEGVNYDLTLRR